jgi:hypothetical protein
MTPYLRERELKDLLGDLDEASDCIGYILERRRVGQSGFDDLEWSFSVINEAADYISRNLEVLRGNS